jgi:hypothetical protein
MRYENAQEVMAAARAYKVTTLLQNAMMLSSIIGSILSNYDPKVARDTRHYGQGANN